MLNTFENGTQVGRAKMSVRGLRTGSATIALFE